MEIHLSIALVFSVLCSLFLARQLYRKEVLDRILLGAFLCAVTGVVALVGNISCLLYFYNMSVVMTIFAWIFIVGVITTFYTRAGFIGVQSADEKDIRIASLKLLIITLFGVLWSLWIRLYLGGSSVAVEGAIPIMILRWSYDRWGRKLRGEKSSTWTFKW